MLTVWTSGVATRKHAPIASIETERRHLHVPSITSCSFVDRCLRLCLRARRRAKSKIGRKTRYSPGGPTQVEARADSAGGDTRRQTTTARACRLKISPQSGFTCVRAAADEHMGTRRQRTDYFCIWNDGASQWRVGTSIERIPTEIRRAAPQSIEACKNFPARPKKQSTYTPIIFKYRSFPKLEHFSRHTYPSANSDEVVL